MNKAGRQYDKIIWRNIKSEIANKNKKDKFESCIQQIISKKQMKKPLP